MPGKARTLLVPLDVDPAFERAQRRLHPVHRLNTRE